MDKSDSKPTSAATPNSAGPDEASSSVVGRTDSNPDAAVVAKAEDAGVERARRSRSKRDAAPRRTAGLTPEQVLTNIFTEFAARRKQEKVAAWMGLQTALAENAGVLCPAAVSLKDLIAATANVEDMLKGQQGDAGKSPQEYLEKWLTDTKPV